MANGQELPTGFQLEETSQLPPGFQVEPQEDLVTPVLETIRQAPEALRGVGQAVASVAAQPFTELIIPGGVGAIETIRDGGLEGAERVREVQQQLEIPVNEQGKQLLGLLGEGLQQLAQVPGIDKIIEGAGSFRDLAAQTVGDFTGALADPINLIERTLDPTTPKSEAAQTGFAAGAAITEAAPETALAAAAFKGSIAKPGELSKQIAKIKEPRIRLQQQQAVTAPQFPRQINAAGIQEAIRQGLDEGVAAFIEGSSAVDKSKFRDMINTFKRVKKDVRGRLLDRPSDVAGQSVLDRFKFVRDVNRRAGSEIDRIANQQLKGQRVDISDARLQFVDDLEDLGVNFNQNLDPIFKGSDVVGGKEAIVNIFNRLKSTRSNDALNAHKLKRFIDANVSFGKSQTGLDAQVQNMLKRLRSNIDNQLDNQFNDYAQANTTYAQTIGALDELQSVAGRQIDLTGRNANKAVGTLLRRISSNAQSRVRVLDAVNQLDEVATANGAQFQDDILSQIGFVDTLDDIFGTTAGTSFQGQIRRGTGDLSQVPTTKGQLFQEGEQKLIDKVRNINEEAALKALEDLIQEQQ